MSFLSRLLGKTFESLRAEGDAHMAAGRLGEAKLAYERALARTRDATSSEVEVVSAKIRECRLGLARARLDEADTLVAEGDLDLAASCIADAREICDFPEILDAVAERQKRIEGQKARALMGDERELSEDELLAIIAGTWTEPQAEEYAALPDEFREALLASHDGDHERAAALIRDAMGRADPGIEPVYAWWELGQEIAARGDASGAIEAIDHFLEKVEAREIDDPEVEIRARSLKARCLVQGERFDEAKAEILETTRLAPEDHTVFLNYGIFLRSRGAHEDAVAALERAVELMGQIRPDTRVIRELGLTYLAMGRRKEAMAALSSVLEHSASRGEHDQFDPIAGTTLARLHEEDGAFREAADIFRHLAAGHDTANHFAYNLESARLLRLAGAEPVLVERYLARAEEIATSEEQRARVRAARTGAA